MPKDYNLKAALPNAQRWPEYARDDTWIWDFLRRAQVGRLATRWDEQPFITPTSFWYDKEDHQILFHSNIASRLRANVEHHDQVCFEASDMGRYLPSNVALEFSVQYASVIAFGQVKVPEDPADKRRALYGLIAKYFPGMRAGQEYRPFTDQELARSSVYAMAVESWSGKENWPKQAEQGDQWPPLDG